MLLPTCTASFLWFRVKKIILIIITLAVSYLAILAINILTNCRKSFIFEVQEKCDTKFQFLILISQVELNIVL